MFRQKMEQKSIKHNNNKRDTTSEQIKGGLKEYNITRTFSVLLLIS